MDKMLKGSKADEIFLTQKNAYSKLINKNHIFNNAYINIDVYTKWRNLTIDRDEKKIWEDRMICMVLNMDSNSMDKSVRNLIRRGVPDSLKHLIWMRSNDVNYFAINFPKFYETTLYNTFGDIIPEHLSNDCPTFCGGILGLQEDIMCVQTKIEEIEIENTVEGDNFNINDSTSNILQLLFNTPNELKKDSDKYLLPEHNFWIEPKALSSPNFFFASSTVNPKKKKKFFYIESMKNKILKSKKLDSYLRVSSDSVLPCPNAFEGQNGEGNKGKEGNEAKEAKEAKEGKEGKKHLENEGIGIEAKEYQVKVIRNNYDNIMSEEGMQRNKERSDNTTEKRTSFIKNSVTESTKKKETENVENKNENEYKNIQVNREQESFSANGNKTIADDTTRKDKGEKGVADDKFQISNNSDNGKNIFIKDDIISFEEINDRQGKNGKTVREPLESLLRHIEKEKKRYANISTEGNVNSTKYNNEITEANKYLHIQYYMNEQYRISKKQAEKMSKAKLYLRNKKKKKSEKHNKEKGESTCTHGLAKCGNDESKDAHDVHACGCCANSEKQSLGEESECFGEDGQEKGLKKTRSFFKKKFNSKPSFSRRSERNLSDHITLLLNENALLDSEDTDIMKNTGMRNIRTVSSIAQPRRRGASMANMNTEGGLKQSEKEEMDKYDLKNKLKNLKTENEQNKEKKEKQEKSPDISKQENEELNMCDQKSSKSKKHIVDSTKWDRREHVVEALEGGDNKNRTKVSKKAELESNETKKKKHETIPTEKKSFLKKIKGIFAGKKKEKKKEEETDVGTGVEIDLESENNEKEMKKPYQHGFMNSQNDSVKKNYREMDSTERDGGANKINKHFKCCGELDPSLNEDEKFFLYKKGKNKEVDIARKKEENIYVHHNNSSSNSNSNSGHGLEKSSEEEETEKNVKDERCTYNVIVQKYENKRYSDIQHSQSKDKKNSKETATFDDARDESNKPKKCVVFLNNEWSYKKEEIKISSSSSSDLEKQDTMKGADESYSKETAHVKLDTCYKTKDNKNIQQKPYEHFSSENSNSTTENDKVSDKKKEKEYERTNKEEREDNMLNVNQKYVPKYSATGGMHLTLPYRNSYDDVLENFHLPSRQLKSNEKEEEEENVEEEEEQEEEQEEENDEEEEDEEEEEKGGEVGGGREKTKYGSKKKKKKINFKRELAEEKEFWKFDQQKGKAEMEEKQKEKKEKKEMAEGIEIKKTGNNLQIAERKGEAFERPNGFYNMKDTKQFENELYQKFYESYTEHSEYPNVYNLDDATELTVLLNDDGKHEIKKLLWAINNNFGNDVEFAPIIPNLCIVLLIYFNASVVYCIVHCLIKKGIDSIKNKETPFFVFKRKDFVKYIKYILNSFIRFLPKCYYYLRKLNFDLAAWTARCIQDGFSRMLPFDFVLRIYGAFLFEGQKTLCLYCLALLKFLENDILKCTNIEEVENILYHICMHPYLNINELTHMAYKFKLKSKDKQLKFSTKCPSPYLMNVKMKTFYRPRLNDTSLIISSFHWENIWAKIPSNIRALDPFLTYCSQKDGYSLRSLLDKTEMYKRRPMILFLQTVKLDLIGFFCPFSLNRDMSLFKDVDKSTAFVCSFHAKFNVYRWSGKNNMLVLIKDGIYIGGNDIAIYIDTDIKYGKTNPSESFLSPSLVSEGSDFQIKNLEMWHLK